MTTAIGAIHEPQPVRKHSHLFGRTEGNFWRPFNKMDVGRFMKAAERFERAGRAKGQRCGFVTPSGDRSACALEVLRELLRLVDFRTGRLDPSIDYLQKRLSRSRAAVVRALAALRHCGFLDWLRRYEPTGNTEGPRVKQISNAYRITLPPAAAKLLGAFHAPQPIPDDQAVLAAQQARTVAEAAFSETPLGSAFERLAAAMAKRESAGKSQSGMTGLESGVRRSGEQHG